MKCGGKDVVIAPWVDIMRWTDWLSVIDISTRAINAPFLSTFIPVAGKRSCVPFSCLWRRPQ